jgi:hypothetical protein
MAIALGVGVAVLVSACAGSNAKLIPVASSEPLQNDFEAVAAAAASGGGSCKQTEEALLKTDEDFDKLPASVDTGLRSRLREGIAKLHEDALAECAKQTSTPSTSTKTSTTKSTPTTQTSTTTSTETQTTTGETNTATTPPTTTPGGGTQVPENEGAGPNGGTGVGEGAPTPGAGAEGNGAGANAPGVATPGAGANSGGGAIGQLLRRLHELRRRYDRAHDIHRGRR